MSTTISPRERRSARAVPPGPPARDAASKSPPTPPAPTPNAPQVIASVATANETTSLAVTADSVLRQLHFTRIDGRPCFADPATPAIKTLGRVPRELAGNSELKAVARRVAARDGRPADAFKGLPKPAAAYHREEACCSLLRTDWSASAAQLAIDWSSSELQIDFCVGRDVVFAGRAAPAVTVNGTLRRPTGTWNEVVWLSDVDADYLELEIELEGGVRLQRQFLLTRRDGWLYTADVVLLGDTAQMSTKADIEVRLTLPCSGKVAITPAGETCEATLVIGRRQMAVIPPGLPEWRVGNRQGTFTAAAGELAVTMAAHEVRALYVPLAVQFDSARARKPLTWRRLTVGENLEITSSDRAVGYRLQFGREHWLVYRSLTTRANRTVLGVNLQTDFLFSRFTSEGESEPLMEIE
jgi:hypothetical protein